MACGHNMKTGTAKATNAAKAASNAHAAAKAAALAIKCPISCPRSEERIRVFSPTITGRKDRSGKIVIEYLADWTAEVWCELRYIRIAEKQVDPKLIASLKPYIK